MVVASWSRIYPFSNCLNLPLRSSETSRSSRSWWWRFRSVLPIYLAVPIAWNITCTDCLPSPITSRTYQGCLSLCSSAPWRHLVWLLRLRRWFRRSLSWRRRWYDVRRRWGWCWHCPRIFIFIVILRCIFFLSEEPLQKMKIAIFFWLLYSTFSPSQDWSNNKMTVWTRRSVCHVQRQIFWHTDLASVQCYYIALRHILSINNLWLYIIT